MSEEGIRVNLLDRAISFVNPAAGLARMAAREQLHLLGYDGATPGRLRGGSGGLARNAGSSTPRMQRDRVNLMWDARDLDRNFGLIGGLMDKLVMYAFGRIRYKHRSGDRAINKLVENYFHDWCGKADYTGRKMRLRELVSLGFRSMMVDGDFGFHKVWVDDGLRLQGVEADRIGNPLMAGKGDEKEIGGVMIDKQGRPLSYKIYQRSRSNRYTFEKEILARNFLHLVRRKRMDQYRGVSWLASAVPHARDLYETIGMEKQRHKYASSHAGIIKSREGGIEWDTPEAAANGDKKPATITMQAGKIVHVPEGKDMVFAPAIATPGPAFLNLSETIVREIANGIPLPFGFVWDMARLGGVTARLEIKMVVRLIELLGGMAVDLMLNEVKNDVVSYGIVTGDIPEHENWRSGVWNFGAKLTADTGHEVMAGVQLLQNGLTTATRIMSDMDEDFEEVTEESAGEVQFMQETAGDTEIPIELINPRFPNATQLLAAINTPPQAPPPPEPGLIGQVGEKGVKPLMEIFTKFNQGELDRDTAINNVMALYGLGFAEADALVPVVTQSQVTPSPPIITEE
ncbi:MAG: phage portal protein [Verrucomicrobiales bacterium]|jgi:capsid protein|nr:phage portal protein [Verrucomicrobiales bacterium]